MHGVKIGHYTDAKNGTGISIFIFENAAQGAYLISGSAPASHELAALDPDNSVPHLHGLCFSGGSAFGLFCAQGVMTYLAEQNMGHLTLHGVVPIVPAAAIFDLGYNKSLAPTAQQAYEACVNAQENNLVSGRIGAGTGATVGKMIPHARHMTGGLGRAAITITGGIEVIAYAVVNCVGDVVNEKNQIIAGACDGKNKFYDSTKFILSGEGEINSFSQKNTTLTVVMTNAYFAKDTLKRICKMGIAGIARAISPIFTRYDGDIIFCISTGNKEASELTIGTLAAESVRLAILDAVKDSEVI